MNYEISFNASMVLIDLVAIGALWRWRKRATAFWAMVGAAVGAILLASFFGTSGFGVIRLLAYAIFVHGILLTTACGVLLWRGSRSPAVALFVLATATLCVGIDAFLIEPRALILTRFKIAMPELEAPLLIALVADIQTDSVGEYERRALEAVMAERPDLIAFAGDYIQDRTAARSELLSALATLFQEVNLHAPLGIHAVGGDVDGSDWSAAFAKVPAEIYRSTRTVTTGPLSITGLTLLDSRSMLSLPRAGPIHIVLGHAPDFALGNVQADLLLAGHTHGGQVRVPFFGPPITFSNVPRSWARGHTRLSQHKSLVVSAGVGMERGDAPRLRFLCRPEIVFIELVPAKE